MTTVALKLEMEEEQMMIKNEPLDYLPATVVIEMPQADYVKEEKPTKVKTERKRAKATKKDKKNIYHRPAYETNEHPVTCEDCGVKFKNIITHRIKKHGLKFEFKCNIVENCKFSSFDSESYRKHRLTHVPKPKTSVPRVCPYCAAKTVNLNTFLL
jgi:hypothetical protein